MSNIEKNIVAIQTKLATINHTQNFKCIAVSKGQSIESIVEAFSAGLHHFGENYLQEALVKINNLKHLSICWHYIGKIQSKKCTKLAENFDWVHTLDNEEHAIKLNLANQILQKKQNICIQINLADEAQKGGCSPKEASELIAIIIKKCNHLNLKGLMTILPAHLSENQQFEYYTQLKILMEQLNSNLSINMDTLSMGMSNDYPQAIRAGSTFIRIGTAIFGKRPLKG